MALPTNPEFYKQEGMNNNREIVPSYFIKVGDTYRGISDPNSIQNLYGNVQFRDMPTLGPTSGPITVGGNTTLQQSLDQISFQQQNSALNQAAEQRANQSNAQVSSVPVAPTDFQKYFQGEIAKGRAAGDILSNNPYMAGGAQGPAIQPAQIQAASVPNAPQAPQAPTVNASSYTGSSIVDYLKSAGKPTDLASRTKLAAEQGIVGYKGTAEQNLQLLNKLRASNTKTSGAITPGSLDKATPIPTPTPTGNPQADADAVAESVGKQGTSQIEQYLALLNPPETEAQKQEQAILNRISGIVKDGTNRSADQAQAEKDAQIEQKTNDLNAVLGEIKMKEAEYNAYKLAQEGKPITLASITGSIAEKRNQTASEMLLLQAKADILQNNLASAQARVDRAIDLKYDSLDQEYKIYQAQLEALQPTLTREEKQIATAQSLLLQERQQALQDKKDTEKSIQSLVVEAAKNGASQSVLNQMSKATDFNTALQIGATSLAPQIKTTVRSTSSSGGGSSGSVSTGTGKLSSQTQAVVDNPSLFDDLTPTVRGKVIGELQSNGYDTANLGTKPLSDSAIKEISQTQSALSSLQELKVIVQGNESRLGPITGLQALNPWSEAKKIQADVNRVRQTVGKALEGGVLRKEDEAKYKEILAKLTDTPSTALYKIDALASTLQRDIETYKSLQQSGGRSANVNTSLTKKGSAPAPSQADLRNKYNY